MNMTTLLLIFSVIITKAACNANKRILLHGDENVMSEFQRISALVDQLVKDKSETDKKLQNLESEKNETDRKLRILEEKVSKGYGTTYIRWGKTTCPGNGTEIVYTGYVGGSWFNHKGAAANYVCLPTDPIYGVYDDGYQDGGKMYGGEYEYYFRRETKYFNKHVQDHDATCAVCSTLSRSKVVMIPGRNACYPGWTMEFHGYLSAGDFTYPAASEYVCVDGDPDLLPGKGRDDNGKLFYFVEGVCAGSLECPPYVDGRELTCVVCSK